MGPSSAALVNVVRPEPSGHWSGHLASAAISGGVAAAVALGTTLVWTRLPWYVVASVAAMEIGLAAQIVGNLRVARSIWATSYEDVRAVGSSFAGFESGHGVAAWGDGLVVAGGLAFGVLLAVSRRVNPAIA